MPRYIAGCWAWFRQQFDPTLPPAPVLRDTPTPPPTRRIKLVPCPTCKLLVVPGDQHRCVELGGES
jgi:hypothetical protein